MREGDDTGPTIRMIGILRLLWPYRASAVAAAALVFGASALGLVQPLLASAVIDRVHAAEPTSGLALILVALFVGKVLADTGGRYLLERVGESVVLSLRQRLVYRLLRMRISELNHWRMGDLISRANSDTTVLRDGVARSLIEIAVSAATVIGASALMLSLDLLIFLVVFGLFVVAATAVGTVLNRLQAAGAQAQAAVGSFTAELERDLSALRTIRVHQAEQAETERGSIGAEEAYNAGMRAARLSAAATPAIQLVATGSFLFVLLLGGMRVVSGALPLGDLIALLLYTTYLVAPLGNLVQGITITKRAMGALQRVEGALQLCTEPADTARSTVASNGNTASILRFQDVQFAYNDRPALRGVTFELLAGSRTAVVGSSGAGKSTILSLICRFYDPDSGEIHYLNQASNTLTRAQCREQIALVEQDAPVLHGTVRDNLAIAAPHATDEAMRRALHEVNLGELLYRLPSGLETSLGEHGSQLSGGERQRLAIARALLTQPALLLLDEPTSSLDTTNESLIINALRGLPAHCAVLVVAHRLSTIRSADRILLIDNGWLLATGTHEELLQSNPHYRRLVANHVGGTHAIIGVDRE